MVLKIVINEMKQTKIDARNTWTSSDLCAD